MKINKHVSHAQLKMLLDLLSKDGVLIDGKVNTRNVSHLEFWRGVASQLNAVEGGAQKPALRWSKAFSDFKMNTKRKVQRLMEKKPNSTIESLAASDLTKLEVRLLNLMNYPIENVAEPLPTELCNLPTEQINVCTKTESQDIDFGNASFEEAQVDYLVEDYQPNEAGSSYEDNDNEHNLDAISEQSHETYEESNYKKDIKNKIKRRSVLNRQGIYQSKTQLFIEKERILLRREELRLKALELKLKGEQLRLQEKEMNKVNSLMNIEEEKLNCIKEISASLKEFLIRMSNGSNGLATSIDL